MLILVILFGTVFFCHGLIRLVMLVVRGDRENRQRSRLPQMYGPGGYAVPTRPIPVVLTRDEEAAGVESEASKAMPPAYGLWRESVRVDPNRLFWQRTAAADQIPTRHEAHSGPRPPSYISEDGVSYVVEAVPRSTAPTTDVPLPPHPSEFQTGNRCFQGENTHYLGTGSS
ncbi:Fc.00g103190.m01.CDS01 [Cosmosporella sp. VM-42]